MVDSISRMIFAITIGIIILIPALLPQQLSLVMQWYIQWGGYIFKKTLYDLQPIILSVGAIFIVIGVILRGADGMHTILFESN